MKIVILERNSVGTDISVDAIGRYGEVTAYANTTGEEAAGRIADAEPEAEAGVGPCRTGTSFYRR